MWDMKFSKTGTTILSKASYLLLEDLEAKKTCLQQLTNTSSALLRSWRFQLLLPAEGSLPTERLESHGGPCSGSPIKTIDTIQLQQ